jgi:hypothetical protein
LVKLKEKLRLKERFLITGGDVSNGDYLLSPTSLFPLLTESITLISEKPVIENGYRKPV